MSDTERRGSLSHTAVAVLVVGAVVLGLFRIDSLFGVDRLAAETLRVKDKRVSWVMREHLDFAVLMAKPEVDGQTPRWGEVWELQQGALLPNSIIAWIDRLQPDVFGSVDQSFGPQHASGRAWKPEYFRGPLWRCVLEGGLELYRLELNRYQAGSEYWLFLRDQGSGRISARPFVVDARWMQGSPPEVESLELDGQGRCELVCEGVGHNGTVYNAKKSYFLEIQEDLELRLVLEIDTHLGWPLGGRPGDVYQRLRRLGRNDLEIEGAWVNSLSGAPRRLIGRVQVRRSGFGSQFRVVSREDLVENADWWVGIVEADEGVRPR